MTQKINDETKIYLEAFLPDAISQTLESYQRFLNSEGVEQNKEFLEFHKACKAAISNIEQLLKLCKWAEGKEIKVPQGEDIKLLMEKSQQRLSDYKGK